VKKDKRDEIDDQPTLQQQILGEKYSKHLKTATSEKLLYQPKQPITDKAPT
jgi:hypothetical protein